MSLRTIIVAGTLLVIATVGDYVGYPRPSIYEKSAHFSLRVNGTQMYTISYAGYDYVQVSMDEDYDTEFRIRTLSQGSTIDSYTISPQSLPIEATIDGDELVFSLKKAHYLIVKIDNLKEFVILADPTETDVPDPDGGGVHNVLRYNADNTGGTITSGIQDAIDAAAETPGSIVYVPPGLYSVGNLLIRNQTSLYLAGGSVLRFTGNPNDYTTLFTKSDLHPGTWWLRTEVDSSDIKVYGRGTIDGNGYNTRQNQFMADLLVPVGTKNFNSDGILVRDSSFWAVTPIQVEDATLTNLKILGRHDVTQNDGVDVVESRRVTVKRAIAIANDDSFSTKTWPYKTGTTVPYPYHPLPLSDVIFDDCLAWTHCYGYKVGQGVHQKQDNITFQNSVVYTAGVGLGIHHLFGTSTASNITFKNIDVEDLHGNSGGQATWLAVFVDQGGRGLGPIENVYVKNIQTREQGSREGLIQGYDSSNLVTEVTLEDIYMWPSSTPARTLEEMNLVNTTYSNGIEIINS